MPPKLTAPQQKGQKSLFSFFNKASVVSTPSVETTQTKDDNKNDDNGNAAQNVMPESTNSPKPVVLSNNMLSPSMKQEKSKASNIKIRKNVIIDDDEEEWSDSDINDQKKKTLSNIKRPIEASVNTETNKRTKGSNLKRKNSVIDSDDDDDLIDSESSASFDDDDDDDDDDEEEEDDDEEEEDDDDFSDKKPKKKNPSKSNTTKFNNTRINKKTCPQVTKSASTTGKNTTNLSLVTTTPMSNLKSQSYTPTSGVTDTDNGPCSQITPTTTSSGNVLILPEGVVGLGSHEHNTYEWLKPNKRKDKNLKPLNHPEYNHRTLYIPENYLKEQTPAMAQWWKFKSENMDTVLFFKVGKFYELFHMDADVGMSELDLIYMKGPKGHSGFPEVSYGKFASILVSRGYRVARIEQTETPEMLKDRNDQVGKGEKKDKVVKRELCSVMSKGTRTFCHLDDLTLLGGSDNASAENTSSLLICIKEKQTPFDMEQWDEATNSVNTIPGYIPEYGICCIDSVLGTVTLAQFQDDVLRSRLRTMLAQYTPSEVLLEKNKFSSETLGVVKLVAGSSVVVEYLHTGQTEMPVSGQDVICMLQHSRYFHSPTSTQVSEKDIHDSWPDIMKAVVAGVNDGSSELVLIALGGALWQLKRSLIDYEVLSMKKIFGYVPPDEQEMIVTSASTSQDSTQTSIESTTPSADDDINMNSHDVPTTNSIKLPNSTTCTANQYSSMNAAFIAANTNNVEGQHDEENNDILGTQIHAQDLSSQYMTTTVFMTEGPLAMTLDAVALTNLEILKNNFDHSEKGSLWSFVNHCSTGFGSRLLKDWICHPLYRIQHITHRSNAVEELLTSCNHLTVNIRNHLKSLPDLERLLARVHSNGLKKKVIESSSPENGNTIKKANINSIQSTINKANMEFLQLIDHPDTRAVMYEDKLYNTKKIKDFIQILSGFEQIIKVINLFSSYTPQTILLTKLLKPKSNPKPNNNNNLMNKGRFPLYEMQSLLKYYREIFDEKEAQANGFIKPKPGVDVDYDKAKTDIARIQDELEQYLRNLRKETGLNDLKYWGSNKDRYQIEVDMNKTNRIPKSWVTKSQKKTHRRYRTDFIEEKLIELTDAEDRIDIAQKDTLRKIFEKFDDNSHIWHEALTCISTLDALLSIAYVSSSPNYTWPVFLNPFSTNANSSDGNNNGSISYVPPTLDITDGRHPMLEHVFSQRGDTYIPNSVRLGGCDHIQDKDNNCNIADECNYNYSQMPQQTQTNEMNVDDEAIVTDSELVYNPRLLLLSGPNMGGKSTLLRQTCLIAILAQTGFKVPASHCVMTPIDRIFTRVGASDKILSGQSTFFVELAETASMLKSATRHSLCILDELGRGTATFDGTAIAHAVIHHLITVSHCCTLFATHYHSLVTDWEMDPRVKLGHMECYVEDSLLDSSSCMHNKDTDKGDMKVEEVTFLFQLRDGSSPKSYGINVARLAGLPLDVIQSAIKQSQNFENSINKKKDENMALESVNKVSEKEKNRWEKIYSFFEKLISVVESKNYNTNELASYAKTLWDRYHVMKLETSD